MVWMSMIDRPFHELLWDPWMGHVGMWHDSWKIILRRSCPMILREFSLCDTMQVRPGGIDGGPACIEEADALA